MDSSKKEQSGEPRKKETGRSRISSIFNRDSAVSVDQREPKKEVLATSSKDKDTPVLDPPTPVNRPSVSNSPPLAPQEGLKSYPHVSRIGNHEIIWREDALGFAWPTLKHLAPTCMAGLLLVRVKQARALANPSSFGGKQTPYCKLEIGKTVRKTPKLKNAGSAPVWESTQQFSLGGTETELVCTVLSKRGMSRDPIGRCVIQLEYLLQLANPGSAINSTAETDTNVDPETVFHESWFEVRTNNALKYAGEVLLRVQFFPDMAKFTEAATTANVEKAKGGKKKKFGNESGILEDIRKGNALKGKVKIFGGTLKTAVALSKHSVPRVVKDCVTYLRANGLDEVGLFRIPGNYIAVETLKRGFDDGIDVGFENAHDCGAVLKLYLRELKEPLIPFGHYEHFLAVQKKYGAEHAANATEDYRILMSSLPQTNRDLLGYLCAFLEEVAEHETNRMNIKNVAIVFAPNVLRPQVETAGSMTADMPLTIEVMEALIRYNGEIFPSKQFTRPGRGATVSRDYRGLSLSELEDSSVGHVDDEKRALARVSTPSYSGTNRAPSVVVDSYTSNGASVSKREESVTSTMTQTSEEAEEDFNELEVEEVAPPRRQSSNNRTLDVDELRRELELCRANNEALKDTVTQLNLQIEDIKAGVTVPLDVSPRPKADGVANSYYAMREARVGALKTFANQPVAVPKVRVGMNEAANGGKGSSGQLQASVGRTVRARGNSAMTKPQDLDVYEVLGPLRVRDAPSTAGAEIGVLDIGQKVNCLDIRGIWLKHDAGWSMMQTDPGKDGPRKQFLVLHNPISRRTDRSMTTAVAATDAAGVPLNPYAAGMTVSPTLSSATSDDRMDPISLPRTAARKDEDERVARLREGPRRSEPVDLKAFIGGAPGSAPVPSTGSPRAPPAQSAVSFVPSF